MKPTRAAPVSFSSPRVKSRTKVHRLPSREAWKANARPVRLTLSQTELPSTVKELASSECPRVTTVQTVGTSGEYSRQSLAQARSATWT
ncbi:hypothetical protein AQJ23_37340 [Streptomyces antibioticus]|nr:hypothetical protein AQJ23_37340 [Streptomyces antibioticus]